jgi:hypothetical protein
LAQGCAIVRNASGAFGPTHARTSGTAPAPAGRAHRSQRLRMAENVSDWLGGSMGITGAGIDRLGDLLTRRMGAVEMWRAQVEQLMSYQPDVREMFGEPTLIAAAIAMPAGVCRTCYATAIAQMRDLTLPIPDTATVRLLGPTCPRCLPELLEAAVARMPPMRRRQRLPLSSPALASPVKRVVPSVRHSLTRCRVCELSAAASRALTAAGREDRELSELGARSHWPHELQPIRGARLVSVVRRGGILRTRYSTRDAS